jgi:hypothetical protein
MAEFFQADSKGACIFAIVEEGSKLSFGATGDDFVDDLTENVNTPLDGGVRALAGGGLDGSAGGC